MIDLNDSDYEYGFHDDIKPKYSTGRGLTEETVREISAEKNEPQWMLDYRLKSYEAYKKLPMPAYGPDLSKLDLKNMLYYQKNDG
jgi:ABC-type transport system involved in Fe-S cluster assembly, permease component